MFTLRLFAQSVVDTNTWVSVTIQEALARSKNLHFSSNFNSHRSFQMLHKWITIKMWHYYDAGDVSHFAQRKRQFSIHPHFFKRCKRQTLASLAGTSHPSLGCASGNSTCELLNAVLCQKKSLQSLVAQKKGLIAKRPEAKEENWVTTWPGCAKKVYLLPFSSRILQQSTWKPNIVHKPSPSNPITKSEQVNKRLPASLSFHCEGLDWSNGLNISLWWRDPVHICSLKHPICCIRCLWYEDNAFIFVNGELWFQVPRFKIDTQSKT